ncbi:hypothetical protein [Streptacidiphilus jiangxiensis]|uniref:Uncharacterized protein n=1 Tax=Streptacidiphilus jiangxiensis TaxID=235985 RepID=A0A1H8BJJ9_STRJI|nr:hypothetical protein [Streptacidiphilus jiangxiensis]SEM82228.1 hypothetical protein SAMN05414137_1665 [Streptacidiphilus jiangxiensis]
MDVPAPLSNRIGTGTVYLQWVEAPDEQPQGYYGYWEATALDTPEVPSGNLEESPVHPEAVDAVAWARKRTGRVVIQVQDGRILWAGTNPMPDDPDLAGEWHPLDL